MPKKKPVKGKPDVHEELEGFEIHINEFGEINSSMDINQLNEFLNKNVEDKKLKDRDDLFPIEEEEENTDDELFSDDVEDINLDTLNEE